ncbi:DUF2793 domain-containing protein [Variovorax sp. GT1P44]|uniref:DUF2793 domain-containing protein n=1 Tax=Variovorax sp. GT1P44 TaxID=3443742 RepID=UPI003F48B71B
MSTPILPFAVWLSGTNQNSIPANDNSLRNQILNGNVISQAVTAQPASPTDGDIYIIAATHTGAQWAGFTPKDLAIYSGGTWYAFAPVAGVTVNVAGSLYSYQSGAWTAAGGTFTGGTLSSALNEAPTVTIASSATPAIGAAAGNSISLTGTTTVTGFDTIAAGAFRRVIFAGVLTLTHNATSLILPTGANITTAAGDVAEFLSLGSGNWRCVAYTRADGSSLSGLSRSPNVQAVTSSATVTPTFSNDAVKITAQAAGLTLANPTGTAIDMLGMVIRIKDNGTARAISYGTQYRALGITLPTTTVISKTTYIAMVYNSDDTKWDCVATGTEP